MVKDMLLVEDNPHKRERILAYLFTSWPSFSVDQAHSFTSGSRMVIAPNNYKLILLDMSLPTYDKSASESGGKFRTLGGREVARKSMKKGGRAKILFLTQYNAFSEGDVSHNLQTLDKELQVEFADLYRGLIQYDSSQTAWKEKIAKVIKRIINENINC